MQNSRRETKGLSEKAEKNVFFFVYFSEKMKNGQRNWVGGSGGGQKEIEKERRFASRKT